MSAGLSWPFDIRSYAGLILKTWLSRGLRSKLRSGGFGKCNSGSRASCGDAPCFVVLHVIPRQLLLMRFSNTRRCVEHELQSRNKVIRIIVSG